jgi:hypothetical protein
MLLPILTLALAVFEKAQLRVNIASLKLRCRGMWLLVGTLECAFTSLNELRMPALVSEQPFKYAMVLVSLS